MTKYTLRLLAAASAFALSAGSALAQESTFIEEIVVTAQKREQQALDVPMSLTAYSAQRLDALGVQDFADVALFTPGFEVQEQSPNNPGFVMRGITSDATSAFSEARVSVFQDGVSISKAQGSYVELFDLDRIEIAKGPQSTLFGRGALIGGVNIIQKKANPADGVSGYLKGEAGDLGYVMAEGAVNLPVSDAFALRFAGRLRQRDGYVENALGGDAFQSVDSWAGRVSANFSPDERLNADFILNYQHDEPTGTSFRSGFYSPTDPVTGQVLGGRGARDPAALAAAPDFQGGKQLGVDRTVWGVTALVDYKLSDSLSLASITAARRFESQETFDPDGISLPILTGLNDAVGNQWSQELRVNYDAGGRVRGFVGAGYFHEDGRQRGALTFDERTGLADLTGQLNASAAGLGLPASTPAPLAVFGNTAFTGALLRGLVAASTGNRIVLSAAQATAIAANLRANHQEEATNTNELDSVDLFGDLSFDVTDRLEVSAGLRWTHDDKSTGFGSRVVGGRSVLGGVIGAAQIAAAGDLATANAILTALQSPLVQLIPDTQLPMFGLTYQPTARNGDMSSDSLDSSAFTWRLVARYSLSDDANVYGAYSRGRLPEVLAAANAGTPYAAPRFDHVEAETVDSYEVGAKAALADRRLRLDAAAYLYDYDNFQTVEQRGTLFIVTNAGKAKAYGFEAQAELAAASNLDLYATYAYSHARFDGGAYEGNRFRLSPDHSLSLAANLRFPLLGGSLAIRPSYTWQSKVFFSDNNDLPAFQQPPAAFVADNVQDEVQDAYGLANLRVAWTAGSAPLTLEAFVNNIADEDYLIDAGNTGDNLGLPTFIAGPPRMWGVGLTWRFR